MTQNNQLAILQKDITDSVSQRVSQLQEEGLALPQNYSYANALKSAWLKILETKDKNNRPTLEVATKDSIANALFDMVTQGLTPAKTQCYFIVYGNKLVLQRSYFGTQAVLKRLNEVDDIWANVIYQDDIFEFENRGGKEYLVKHETKFENKDKPIVGAYAIVKQSDGEEVMTSMTRKEIETAWRQSMTGRVQKMFPQEMAKRTVINRAAKHYINTSDDSDLLTDSIRRTTENEYDNNREFEEVQENDTAKNLIADFKKEEQAETGGEEKQLTEADEEQEVIQEQTEIPWYEMDAFQPMEEEKPKKQKKTIDWENFTVEQIKGSLDKYSIEYPSKANKDELIRIAQEALEGGGEDE